jgi:hypothetical protein
MEQELVKLAKWKLHRFYITNPSIDKYLPPTTVLNPTTLASFMEKYKVLYIKANTQHSGRGIIKAWKSNTGYSYVYVRDKVNTTSNITQLYNEITNRKALYPIPKT